MRITCQAQQTMACAPSAAFALVVDPVRFPATFTGYGPIPGIRAVTLDGPLAVDATRRIHNHDGSTLVETITALDAPTHHAYSLGGFRPPFSWLVSRAEADWTLQAGPSSSQVSWRYTFDVAHAWAYPLAAPLLRWCMARAMRRCLDNIARLLEVPATATSAAGMH